MSKLHDVADMAAAGIDLGAALAEAEIVQRAPEAGGGAKGPPSDAPPQDDEAPPFDDEYGPVPSDEDDDPRPKVNVGKSQKESDIIAAVWGALLLGNQPPHLFNRDGRITRTRRGDSLSIEALDIPRMLYEMRRAANFVVWVKPTNDEERARAVEQGHSKYLEVPGRAPKWVAEDMLSGAPPEEIPVLEAVTPSPVFVGEGVLCVQPGYNATGRLWYEPTPGFVPPEVPTRPTPDQVAAAGRLLFRTWLGQVHVRHKRDRAHMAGLLFLPFVRPMIRAPIPLQMVSATDPNTGKSLVLELFGLVYLGRLPDGTTFPTGDEAAISKKLYSLLLAATPYVVFDNVKGQISSESFEALLTREWYSDRVLGVSRTETVRNRSIWTMAANNPQARQEMHERTVFTELDSEKCAAQAAVGYTIGNIREWTEARRSDLLAAILTLIQAWIAAGSPPPKHARTMRRYEEWARVIGGIVEFCGFEDFLRIYEGEETHRDVERPEWEEFIDAWLTMQRTAERDGNEASDLAKALAGRTQVRYLRDLVDKDHLLINVMGNVPPNDRAKEGRLAELLRSVQGRAFHVYDEDGRPAGSMRIRMEQSGSRRFWRLEAAQVAQLRSAG